MGGGGGGAGPDPRISDTQIANWDISFSWGDHSTAGYLTAETDPTVPDHVKAISEDDINHWNNSSSGNANTGDFLFDGYTIYGDASSGLKFSGDVLFPTNGRGAIVNLGQDLGSTTTQV